MRARDYAFASLAAVCLLAWLDAYRDAREVTRDRDELRAELAEVRTDRERCMITKARATGAYRELHHWLRCARGECRDEVIPVLAGETEHE